MNCDYCNVSFKTKYTLKAHLSNNKSCLKNRGLVLDTKFICNGCSLVFTNNKNLLNHIDICKKYNILKIKEKYEEELIEQKNKSDKENTFIIKELKSQHQDELKELKSQHQDELKELKSQNKDELKDLRYHYELKMNEEYIKLKVEYDKLTEQHNKLTEQYEKTITKLELKISQCDTFIQTLARDGATKATTTTNNTVNNIRNILSPTYTLDKLEPKKIEEKIREHYTERDFFNGQKGLAGVCVDRIIKTPDGKMMICCSDISRKKFKILDVNGNLKEDIEARLFCQQLKVPIQTITKEMYDKIAERIDKERDRLSSDDRSRREKLLDDSMRAQQYFIDNMNFDDLNYNQDFMHELCVLLN